MEQAILTVGDWAIGKAQEKMGEKALDVCTKNTACVIIVGVVTVAATPIYLLMKADQALHGG